MTFDPLTLNDYSVSDVTRTISVPNFSELEQSATELLRFKYDQFWRHLPSRIRQEVDFFLQFRGRAAFFSELSGTTHITFGQDTGQSSMLNRFVSDLRCVAPFKN